MAATNLTLDKSDESSDGSAGRYQDKYVLYIVRCIIFYGNSFR
jgi:hypothetical protein